MQFFENKKNNNNFKSIIPSLLVAMCLIVTSLGLDVVAAGTYYAIKGSGEGENNNGFIELNIEREIIPDILNTQDEVTHDNYKFSEHILGSKSYNSSWDKYSSNYYYNQLSPERKQIWDELDSLALSYLDGDNKDSDIELRNNKYSLGPVMCTKDGTYDTDSVFTSQDDFKGFIYMFLCSNPQYYFFNNNLSIYGDYAAFSIGVYPDFASASGRTVATDKFKSVLDNVTNSIGASSSESDKLVKVKAAHDMICSIMDYNDDVVSSKSDGGSAITPEEDAKYHTQSAYSALVDGKTVCAGYSEAYALICNALNIDSVCVTSSNHEWNEVRVGDSWYNVDCTWDDKTTTLYKYFMVSDNDLLSDSNKSNVEAHTCMNFWTDYKPICSLSIGSTSTDAGTVLPSPIGVVSAPEFTVEKTGSKYRVTIIDATPGATIYYTTDGTTPSPAFTKSSIYKGDAILVSDISKVNAVAVMDKYLDSAVTNAKNSIKPEDPDMDPDFTGIWTDGYYYESGIRQTDLKGLFSVDGTTYYFEDGRVRDDLNGVYNIDGEYYHISSGTIIGLYNFEDIEEIKTVDGSVPMYRMYNPGSGEHFYTANYSDVGFLVDVGWNYENIAWFAPSEGKPLYKMYNPNGGYHFFTTDSEGRDYLVEVGWIYEGISCYSGGNVKIFRAYNPNATGAGHLFTSNKADINSLVQVGWIDEGIAWYAVR